MKKSIVVIAIVCVLLAALLAGAVALADGDKEKRFRVWSAAASAVLFPPGHPFHDPTTAGLLRADCNALGWATFLGDGAAVVSYLGGAKLEQSHCAELVPAGTGNPTGFFLFGQGTFYGEGTDKDGVRNTIAFVYGPTLLSGIPTGTSPWCNPALGPCPFTANGLVTVTGGTGEFSQVSGGDSTAFIVGAADGYANVYSEGVIVSQGPLPGFF